MQPHAAHTLRKPPPPTDALSALLAQRRRAVAELDQWTRTSEDRLLASFEERERGKIVQFIAELDAQILWIRMVKGTRQ